MWWGSRSVRAGTCGRNMASVPTALSDGAQVGVRWQRILMRLLKGVGHVSPRPERVARPQASTHKRPHQALCRATLGSRIRPGSRNSAASHQTATAASSRSELCGASAGTGLRNMASPEASPSIGRVRDDWRSDQRELAHCGVVEPAQPWKWRSIESTDRRPETSVSRLAAECDETYAGAHHTSKTTHAHNDLHKTVPFRARHLFCAQAWSEVGPTRPTFGQFWPTLADVWTELEPVGGAQAKGGPVLVKLGDAEFVCCDAIAPKTATSSLL